MPLGKYPTCAWSSDAFTNWLTQNSINLATNFVTSGIGLGLAGATGGASLSTIYGLSQMENKEQKAGLSQYGYAIDTASNIAGLIGAFYEATLLPNIQGGQATGDVMWAANKICFTYRKMRAKNEYLHIIDDYFSMFGYKVNATKIPNLTGRTNWNFVKTIDANIEGDIPQADIEEIKQIFNTGVTIWHNTSYYLDYTQTNNIIS